MDLDCDLSEWDIVVTSDDGKIVKSKCRCACSPNVKPVICTREESPDEEKDLKRPSFYIGKPTHFTECLERTENSKKIEELTSGSYVEENHNENSDIDVIEENADDNTETCVSPPANLLLSSQIVAFPDSSAASTSCSNVPVTNEHKPQVEAEIKEMNTTEMDSQSQSGMASKIQSEPETESENQSQLETLSENQSQPEMESDNQSQLEMESENRSRPEMDSEIQSQTEAESEIQSRPETDSEIQSQADIDSEIQSQADMNSEIQPQSRNEAETDVNEPELMPGVQSMSRVQSVPNTESARNYLDGREDCILRRVIIFERSLAEWIALITGYLRDTSLFEFSLVFAITIAVYLQLNFHHTKNITVQQKTDALSDIKALLEELKLDNKMMKDQVLGTKEKALSSFEHQIQELKKENSKLNHMLEDVVSLLYKQKDKKKPHNHRKSEFTKLKEQINMLKFDNEELQKQLVRTRYAKHTQGEKEASTKQKPAESKEDANKVSDIINLEKWNELMQILAKELGVLESEQPSDEASSSEESTYDAKVKWIWSDLKSTIKGEISKIQNINISEIFSKYVNYKKEIKKNFWEALGNIRKNWFNIKRKGFKSEENNAQPSEQDATKSSNPDSTQSENVKNGHESEEQEKRKDEAAPENEQENAEWLFERAAKRAELRRQEHVDQEKENTEWMFERAAQRAEIRQEI